METLNTEIGNEKDNASEEHQSKINELEQKNIHLEEQISQLSLQITEFESHKQEALTSSEAVKTPNFT